MRQFKTNTFGGGQLTQNSLPSGSRITMELPRAVSFAEVPHHGAGAVMRHLPADVQDELGHGRLRRAADRHPGVATFCR